MRRVKLLAQGGLVHALLYIRVSGAEHQQEGLSLDYHEKAMRAYVARQPGWIIAGEYRDIESGAHDNRASYQALLTEPRRLNKRQYRRRNLAERFVNRIKHFRRIATRYEKTSRNFLSFVQLAATICWLN